MITFSLEDVQEALEDGTMGFCVECGAEAFGVEPDARNYPCECCEEQTVFGAQELLIMGLVK